ncbi:MAG: carbamate kinase [Calditrichaeota bacterium]|nr:carbamate kinase [Calditrichota bacterium]MCB9366424.1 carbamate kinase [Calditrichota bacterium]
MAVKSRIAVVALGGNAISSPDEPDTIANQFSHSRSALQGVAELLQRGYKLAITHGNGPQVGNALLRVELAHGRTPDLPLGVIVADTEGGMGYMIEQCLQNVLLQKGLGHVEVVTIVSQVVVDPNDPALLAPTKFVGQFYTQEEAQQKAREVGWTVKENGSRGWRRVVGSPMPLEILNHSVIRQLVHAGHVVISAGGGGIPVYREADGWLEGIDAVIDKDRASAVLGRDIDAQDLFILTATPTVSLNFGKPDQKDLPRLSVSEAEKYLTAGQFPSGSMGPKVEAAIKFLREGGERVLICDLARFVESLDGHSGTWILPD